MTKVQSITLSQLIDELSPRSSNDDIRLIQKAYGFSCNSHKNRRRESGELYIEHDLAVAHITCTLGMGVNTITASLLHDVLLEHTEQDALAIQRNFGSEIANLVTALDKLTPYTDKHAEDRDDKTLEAIRRAILTIIEGDTRVILIHLADRLQDLRKANELPTEKRQQIALEAKDIHAPLANRLGIWQVKWELEDLAFRYLEPEQYRAIARQIAERRIERDQRIRDAADILVEKLQMANIGAEGWELLVP